METPRRLIIDRIEDGAAICEIDDAEKVSIPSELLPSGAKNGCVLVESDGRYQLDECETKKRRNAIKTRLERLFED